MKKTILTDIHLSLGAKLSPFGGFLMPIQYMDGIVAEHNATRTGATVFDTCHMGEFSISGKNAVADLEKLLSCPVATIKTGQCRYGFLCNPRGGVVDDQILYRMGEDDFFMVVNAGTQDNDFEWIRAHLSTGTVIRNLSAETSKIDLQGPGSAKILQALMDNPISADLKYYHFEYNSYKGVKILVSRTGYTGEIGFELYSDNATGISLWNDCLQQGAKPAGLGARDTLRLEMGFPLYGHELCEERNAAESGFLRSISSDKEFIGSAVVLDEANRKFRLVALELDGRRAARAHDAICDQHGDEAGTVTSGSFSPSLGKSIAMGYLSAARAAAGTPVIIRNGKQELDAVVGISPLYKKATGRGMIKDFLQVTV